MLWLEITHQREGREHLWIHSWLEVIIDQVLQLVILFQHDLTVNLPLLISNPLRLIATLGLVLSYSRCPTLVSPVN